MSRSTSFIPGLLVAVIAVKLAFFWWGGVQPFQGADSHSYYSLTTNLTHGGGLRYIDNGAPDMVLHSFRPPLYPIFMSVVFRVVGDRPSVVLIVQMLLGVASVYLLYALGRTVFGERSGRWAGILGAAYWLSMFFENQIYTESLFAFLFLCANYMAMTIALDTPRRGLAVRAAVAGVFFGLAILCRPSAALAVPLIVVWVASSRSRAERPALIPVATVLVACVLVLLPWWIRNFAVHGTFVPFVTSGGLNFWAGNRVQGGAGALTAAWEIMQQNPNGLSEVELNRWFYRDALGLIWQNPGHFVNMLRQKFLWYWWPLQGDYYQLPYRLLFPFFLMGVGASLRLWRRASGLYLIIASQCIVSVLFAAHARYRYSVDFYVIVLAAFGVAGLVRLAIGDRESFGKGLAGLIVVAGVLFWQLEWALLPLVSVWYLVPVAVGLVVFGALFLHRQPVTSAPNTHW